MKLFQLAVLATVLACTPYFFGFILKLDAVQIGVLLVPALLYLLAIPLLLQYRLDEAMLVKMRAAAVG